MITENLKSHLIDQYSIFGEYKQPENRVTCALLHIINYCGSELIDKIIEAFGGDTISSQPMVATQILLRDNLIIKDKEGKDCCADGVIACNYNYKIYIESKITCNSVREDQLNAYRNVVSMNSNEYLLYLTPDAEKPIPLDDRDYWINWNDINNLLDEHAKIKEDKLLDYLVEQFHLLTQNIIANKTNKTNIIKEKSDLEEFAKSKLRNFPVNFDAKKEKDEQVLIVGGRWGEKIAVRFDFYACQSARYFFPTKYLAFYYDNRIKYLFQIIGEPTDVIDLSEASLSIDKEYFSLYDKNYMQSNDKSRELFKLRLVKIFEGEGIVNDNKDKNGRSCAFVQRQRYTIIERIVNAKYTSQL